MIGLIRLAVIDDHPLFREGMVGMLTGADGEVVGQGSTAVDELAPDAMLLDVCLPGGGLEAAGNIARTCAHVRTVMLTASEDEQHVGSALQAGARGYILKGSSGREVVETVRNIARGDSYVAPNLAV